MGPINASTIAALQRSLQPATDALNRFSSILENSQILCNSADSHEGANASSPVSPAALQVIGVLRAASNDHSTPQTTSASAAQATIDDGKENVNDENLPVSSQNVKDEPRMNHNGPCSDAGKLKGSRGRSKGSKASAVRKPSRIRNKMRLRSGREVNSILQVRNVQE